MYLYRDRSQQGDSVMQDSSALQSCLALRYDVTHRAQHSKPNVHKFTIGIKTSFGAITCAECGLYFILALLIRVVVKEAACLQWKHSIFNPANDLRHLRGAGITDCDHVVVNGPRQTVSWSRRRP